ncbi:transcriptional regulator [Mesorhizobium sp. L-8-10]|uniref:ArsR/SmtB family transcription factor n=1 Tax=unclassified Mesorhizobium TaxID=325217 RepID=UPI0019291324|nr:MULTISPECIES: metalloregulator ArsR/SmtB family transcription factor [unclassified Mesorhizobium]BCH24588.1 transcriptional regulator [Mesorhizobium sp. L-8-3]BCH32324.1 transcriptional regulator [Mesorhizobium sp. L-8-10]
MLETEIFKALADPTRRAVFERLTGAEMSVGELKAGFAISQPAVSQHLASLKRAGLVVERRDGRNTYYRLEPDGMRPLLAWMERYRLFWPERVEKLRDVLKDMDQ